MIRLVSDVSGVLYRRAFKPLLFKQHPDRVHANLLRVGGHVQRVPALISLMSVCWNYRNKARLSQTIGGTLFENPVGLAAGFDKNIELLHILESVGFGFITGGSVTHKPTAGNPRPWFHRLPKSKSLVVHVGLANKGAEQIRQRIRQYSTRKGAARPLVVSVAKTNDKTTRTDSAAVADYVNGLKTLRQEKAITIFEINISCPNAFGGEPFTTPERLNTLLSAVDALSLKQPVWIKMPINLPWKELDALLQIITKHTVEAVTIGNLQKQRINTQLKDPLPKTVQGSLSGLPTQELSDKLIAQTYSAYGDKLMIIGVGGIFSAEDAYRKICLGASLVELITGIIFEGPQLIGQINVGLVQLLEKDGFRNISEAVGSKNHQKDPSRK
jgi:dihydroorotate dehydrogenase (fumarate)